MTKSEAAGHIGDLVRMQPRKGTKAHYGRGRIVSVRGNSVEVQVLNRHRKTELFPVGSISLWRAGNELATITQQRRRR